MDVGNPYGPDILLCIQVGEKRLRSWSAIGEVFYRVQKKAIEEATLTLTLTLTTTEGIFLGNDHGWLPYLACLGLGFRKVYMWCLIVECEKRRELGETEQWRRAKESVGCETEDVVISEDISSGWVGSGFRGFGSSPFLKLDLSIFPFIEVGYWPGPNLALLGFTNSGPCYFLLCS